MTHSYPNLCLIFLFSFSFFCVIFHSCESRTFVFDIHHRFSDTVKQWVKQKGHDLLSRDWPEIGTVDYYKTLVDHDRYRGRGLLTFSEGNRTIRISSLAWLHYTFVSLGTPSEDFLVALDTGSDLFWVPCNCTNCAPTDIVLTRVTQEPLKLNIYQPSESKTKRSVPCNHTLCESRNKCLKEEDDCPYIVAYLSSNTFSTGYLVEDILHLRTEDEISREINSSVVFGCSQKQTGAFLQSGAINGLLGLGLEKISVPSILAKRLLIPDSFSMCFGSNGIGRISFGDKGTSEQKETPFSISKLQPTYDVRVTGVQVDTNSANISFSAIIDSGTSFTLLAEPVYKRFVELFHSHVKDKRIESISDLPFEYCYSISSVQNNSMIVIPSLNLTLAGGSQFSVLHPIVILRTSNAEILGYCLGVIKNEEDRAVNISIIGQNFLTGYRIVFDREKLVMGWQEFDCNAIVSSDNSTTMTSVNTTSTSVNTTIPMPRNFTPEATRNWFNRSDLPGTSDHSFTLSSLTNIYHITLLSILVHLILS